MTLRDWFSPNFFVVLDLNTLPSAQTNRLTKISGLYSLHDETLVRYHHKPVFSYQLIFLYHRIMILKSVHLGLFPDHFFCISIKISRTPACLCDEIRWRLICVSSRSRCFSKQGPIL